jgi:hypothetical protein
LAAAILRRGLLRLRRRDLLPAISRAAVSAPVAPACVPLRRLLPLQLLLCPLLDFGRDTGLADGLGQGWRC